MSNKVKGGLYKLVEDVLTTPGGQEAVKRIRARSDREERKAKQLAKYAPNIPIAKDVDYSKYILESMPCHVIPYHLSITSDVIPCVKFDNGAKIDVTGCDSEEFDDYIDDKIDKDMLNYSIKSLYAMEGMFAFVAWQWARPLAELLKCKKCLEIMAGRGWLSLALRTLGVDIISTDNFSWANKPSLENVYNKMQYPVTDVLPMNAMQAVETYGAGIDIIVISWCYMDNDAYQAIKRLNEINKNALIVYIGEGYGGCTGDDDFHSHIESVESEEMKKVNYKYQQWSGLHDYIDLYKYVEEVDE